MSAKILVVDDEQDILRIVSFILGNWGFKVLKASNGQEGLDVLADHKPDLILLDASMPVMNGYEMLEQVKKKPKLKDIPIIMLTSHSDPKNINTVVSYGVYDHITKPFELFELREKIDAVLDHRK
jgi:CheY-like chemotaxis protein